MNVSYNKIINFFIKKATNNALFFISRDILQFFCEKTVHSDEIKAWINNNKIIEPFLLAAEDWFDKNNYIVIKLNDPYMYAFVCKSTIKENLPGLIGYTTTLLDEYVLFGNKDIPQLYLFITKLIPTDGFATLDKKISHDFFIVKHLNNIGVYCGYNFSDIKQDITEWCEKNSDKINYIRRFFSKQPKYLGAGSDGSAYDIGNGLVLKLFRNESTYDDYKKTQESLHKNDLMARTEIMIYDTGYIDKFLTDKVYYCIMQKLDPIYDQENFDRDFVDNINELIKTVVFYFRERYSVLTNIKIEYLIDKNSQEVKAKIFSQINEIHSNLLKSNPILISKIEKYKKMNSNWTFLFVEEIMMKFLSNRYDIHYGNVGITPNGQLRYFDPSYVGLSDFNLG